MYTENRQMIRGNSSGLNCDDCTDGMVRPAAKRLCEVQIPISGTASDRHGNARDCRSNPETIVCILLVPSNFCGCNQWNYYRLCGRKVQSLCRYNDACCDIFWDFICAFLGVYSVYFVVTYVGFLRNVESDK